VLHLSVAPSSTRVASWRILRALSARLFALTQLSLLTGLCLSSCSTLLRRCITHSIHATPCGRARAFMGSRKRFPHHYCLRPHRSWPSVALSTMPPYLNIAIPIPFLRLAFPFSFTQASLVNLRPAVLRAILEKILFLFDPLIHLQRR
jgi:hypothetical protein